MRALVTGAGGFIGSNLVRAFVARGDEVHAGIREENDAWRLDDIKNRLHTHPLDMTDAASIAEAVSAAKPDIVYHLAHYGANRDQTDPAMIRRVIIDGTANLYDACRRSGVERIVNAGSASEYGLKDQPMREDMIAEPNTDYGLAKLWATLYGEHLRRDEGMGITTLRLFNVYGPYEPQIRFFPSVVLSLMRGGSPTLSDPETVRDFVYIEDVVAAFLRAPEKEPGVYNVGTGKQTSLEKAAELVRSALGSKAELSWGAASARQYDSKTWSADTARAKHILEWKAETTLAEGVKRTVEWFKENKAFYEHNRSN